jgi:hypothetical protein
MSRPEGYGTIRAGGWTVIATSLLADRAAVLDEWESLGGRPRGTWRELTATEFFAAGHFNAAG